MSNKPRGTLYIGVTSDPVQRVWQHRNKQVDGFTAKYNLTQLVYFELHNTMDDAIQREKRMKKWNREWKISLIEKQNPRWEDLWLQIQ